MDVVERLRGLPIVVTENGRTGISRMGGALLSEAADEIERLRKDLDTKKLAIGALVHAYDNEWKVGDAMVRARKIMADGYDPWVEIEQLKTGNRLHLELAEIKKGEIERLREALQNIASKNPFHNQCPPINDVQFYSQVIVEMVGIARDALKEKE